MRIFPTALSSRAKPKARAPAKEPVPFKEILPLKIGQFVSGKGSKTSDVCCLHEMSILFACLSNNDFQQTPCGKEIQSFQKCYNTYTSEKKQRYDREMKGVLSPGEKNMSAKQLNLLLKQYPHL